MRGGRFSSANFDASSAISAFSSEAGGESELSGFEIRTARLAIYLFVPIVGRGGSFAAGGWIGGAALAALRSEASMILKI